MNNNDNSDVVNVVRFHSHAIRRREEGSRKCRIRKIVTTTATATALKGLLLIDRCCSIALWIVIVNDVHLRLSACVWIVV